MTVHEGDCRAVLADLPADTFHAVVTDPPYGLGFMGQAWDHAVPGPDYWAALLRVARPGAHLVAFGGTRTFHRMMVAAEDAGWELRDTLLWVYGSGFPKSRNLAGDWAGWGSALKPAWEPIILARKPLTGTLAANVARWGCGALNIDGCRIGTNFAATPGPRGGDPMGRWPANLVHDGSAEVVACFPSEAGASAPVRGTEASAVVANTFGERERVPGAFHADTGSAARFFYCAKASREDRNEGCAHLASRPLAWSSGEANPGSFQAEGTDRASPNFHPTVKPTALMRWLARLVTPPGGHVLDPFAGSGSTGKACALEGFSFTGVELDPAFATIARARLAHARSLVAQGASQPALV